jgi:lysozyme
MSDDATAEVGKWEGMSSTPYQDSGGVWTIGKGSTRDWRATPPTPVGPGTAPVTEAVADHFVACELAECARTIEQDVRVPLTRGWLAALEDFVYNVGSGNLKRSTLLALLNAGDYKGAQDQLVLWDRAGGVTVRGLLNRRLDEVAMIQNSPPGAVPIERTT